MVKLLRQKIALSQKLQYFYKEEHLLLRGLAGIFFCIPSSYCKSLLSESLLLVFPKELSALKMKKVLLGTFYVTIRQSLFVLVQGHIRNVMLRGVGFRAGVKDGFLILRLGFSHSVRIKIPKGLRVSCPTRVSIRITGLEFTEVENFTFKICGFKTPEPYKGKGLLYQGQKIRLKSLKK